MIDIERSIPSVIDGMKKSQRQVLCGALHLFKNNDSKHVKVAQLASFIASHVNYAHGETSLNETIISMAQSYAASNNVPLLEGHGAFGTRMQNGKDAASPRYVYASLAKATRKLFSTDDEAVLDYVYEEGQRVQPKFFTPNLPMLLINGSQGIATGYSTFIPCFNPEDIASIVRSLIDEDHKDPKDDPLPYYKGYSANHLTTSNETHWIFRGQLEKGTQPQKFIIKEIPIGYSMETYKTKVLHPLLEDGVLTDFKVDHVDENTPKFIVNFKQPSECPFTLLKLETKFSKLNMVALDSKGKVNRYSTVMQIIHDWLKVKLDFTERKRKFLIQKNEEHLLFIGHKIKFIKSVVDGYTSLRLSEEALLLFMEQSLQIPTAVGQKLLTMQLKQFTLNRVRALETEANNLNTSNQNLKNATAQDLIKKSMNELRKSNKNLKRARDDFF